MSTLKTRIYSLFFVILGTELVYLHSLCEEECVGGESCNIETKKCVYEVHWDFLCPESDMTYTNVSLSPRTLFTYRVVHEEQLNHAQAFEYRQDEGAHLIQTLPDTKKDVLLSLMGECPGIQKGLFFLPKPELGSFGPLHSGLITTSEYQNKDYWIDGNNIEAKDFSSLSEWVTSTGKQISGILANQTSHTLTTALISTLSRWPYM